MFLVGGLHLQACSGGQLLTHQPPPAEVGNGGEAKLPAYQPAPAEEGNGDNHNTSDGSCSDACLDEESEGDDEDYFFGGEAGNSDGEGDADATTNSMDACCPMCHDLFDSPVKTQCGHAFCQVSLVFHC